MNRTNRAAVAALVVLITSACGTNPLAPTPPVAPSPVVMQYDINVPEQVLTQQLQVQYPHGISMSPIAAQLKFDYTCQYQGAPNVYWGPVAPPPGVYRGGGIVVAPANAADQLIFTASDWPQIAVGLAPDTKFTWLGHFVYAQPYFYLPAYGVCP